MFFLSWRRGRTEWCKSAVCAYWHVWYTQKLVSGHVWDSGMRKPNRSKCGMRTLHIITVHYYYSVIGSNSNSITRHAIGHIVERWACVHIENIYSVFNTHIL